MALPPLRDLEDWRDVKGGSPRTPPGGVRVADYQEYAGPPNMNGNHIALWKMLAAGGWSVAAAMVVAYFTALQNKGVTQKEMQEYDRDYSLYAKEKDGLIQHNQNQDTTIGTLQGIQQSNIGKLFAHDTKFHDDERDIKELQDKTKQFGDFVDELRKAKK